MSHKGRLRLAAGLLAAAALLAFLFQDVIRDTVLLPLSYFWWAAGILYRSIGQVVYWSLLVTAAALLAFASLYGRERPSGRDKRRRRLERGPVQNFAWWLAQRQNGVYFKWQIANRLGHLARDILIQRGEDLSGPPFMLSGRGWNPPGDVQAYLESGLNRSFAEFPRRGLFAPPPETPFDMEIGPVIAYLESQLETYRERRN
jgi:hypothetical protein